MAVEYGSTLNTPTLWVNEYLKEKIAVDIGVGVPFFPSMPSNLNDLSEQWVTVYPDDEAQRFQYSGLMATWDRMFKRRRSAFPHIKCEQLIYYFYATEQNVVENMVRLQEEVFRLLDRGDETAEDINAWQKDRLLPPTAVGSQTQLSPEFYFHTFNVYQLEEVRDIIDFGTARTYGGHKIIVEFDYHQMSARTQPNPVDPENPIVIPDGPLKN